MQALSFAVQLLDPRGRCDRKGLLIVACGLLVLQIVMIAVVWALDLGFESPLLIALKLGFVWMAGSVGAKRLHDLGRSGWWMLGFLAGVTVLAFALVLGMAFSLGFEILQPSSPLYGTTQTIAVAAMMAPIFAATLWLHFARGAEGANRYGPEPAGLGFSMPERQAACGLATA